MQRIVDLLYVTDEGFVIPDEGVPQEEQKGIKQPGPAEQHSKSSLQIMCLTVKYSLLLILEDSLVSFHKQKVPLLQSALCRSLTFSDEFELGAVAL